MIAQEHIVVDIVDKEMTFGSIAYAQKYAVMEHVADHQETS
jgi:hypothetical protein